MKDHAIFKVILTKQIKEFAKSMKIIRSGKWASELSEISESTNRLHELLITCSDFFLGKAPIEASETLHYLAHKVEEIREENSALQVFRIVLALKQGAYSRSLANFTVITKSDQKRFFEEFQLFRDHAVEKSLKELLRVKVPIIQKALMQDCAAARALEYRWLLKRLDERRELIFNRIVSIIRSARTDELNDLRYQVEKFCCLLAIAVGLGYQKGKKALQVLWVLHERLNVVNDEEVLRLAIQDLEKDRASRAEKVSDIQKLRLIRNQLGVKQAHSLKMFHEQIPLCLQVLKRHMVTWK